MTDKRKYKIAFKIACALLNGDYLYGYDTDKIFEIMMEKEGCVSDISYENFILEHLKELRGLKE